MFCTLIHRGMCLNYSTFGTPTTLMSTKYISPNGTAKAWRRRRKGSRRCRRGGDVGVAGAVGTGERTACRAPAARAVLHALARPGAAAGAAVEATAEAAQGAAVARRAAAGATAAAGAGAAAQEAAAGLRRRRVVAAVQAGRTETEGVDGRATAAETAIADAASAPRAGAAATARGPGAPATTAAVVTTVLGVDLATGTDAGRERGV